jgi:flagellar basal-body rod modification protein FlgD
MNTSAIGATTATSANSAAIPTAGNSAATKENFLQLLVAQIKHQNPLNPADGTQFLSQLSQFTEMEQMLGMRQDMAAVRALLESANGANTSN